MEQPSSQIHLDLPVDAAVRTPFDQLWGWVRVPAPVEDFGCVALGKTLELSRIVRPNLDPAQHVGFSIFLDLPELLPPGMDVPPHISITCFDGPRELCVFSIDIVNVTRAALDEQRQSRERKRAFVASTCAGRIRNVSGCRAYSALPDGWRLSPLLSQKQDPVSAHFYGPSIQRFLKALGPQAMVLDAGAGYRKLPYENVINLEIYDYPSTDVLATGDQLPFEECVFDAVLSLAVLEHVRDPFANAREIQRVLKPGGKVLAMVPFLQAEHGYPSHYFNATIRYQGALSGPGDGEPVPGRIKPSNIHVEPGSRSLCLGAPRSSTRTVHVAEHS